MPHKVIGVDRPFRTYDMTSLPGFSVWCKHLLAYNSNIFLRINLTYRLRPEMVRAKSDERLRRS